ncbi:fibronectin type III domain-containing protein [Geobacter sp. SVR]|uniref:fibronectin type III domain-containing protein n=1 Tax=Geobacter sp. SVR TaxID=2495594 RepID=UPI00143EF8F5|nr:fibronectin type III domain-containing protein [Geobacter sp. SVR]BCS54944.1 hypothetical protein GSVR_32520 [Geobacter sp. SVR]GCF86143.1 hypothetical protein GSbR_27430 [Geobacter sp. SVR]
MTTRRYMPLIALLIAFCAGQPDRGLTDDSAPPKPVEGEKTRTPGKTAVLIWNPVVDAAGKRPKTLAGYKVYYGKASRSYTTVIDAGAATKYTIHGLAPGTYYFAVTAYDLEGKESNYSVEVKKLLR